MPIIQCQRVACTTHACYGVASQSKVNRHVFIEAVEPRHPADHQHHPRTTLLPQLEEATAEGLRGEHADAASVEGADAEGEELAEVANESAEEDEAGGGNPPVGHQRCRAPDAAAAS